MNGPGSTIQPVTKLAAVKASTEVESALDRLHQASLRIANLNTELESRLKLVLQDIPMQDSGQATNQSYTCQLHRVLLEIEQGLDARAEELGQIIRRIQI